MVRSEACLLPRPRRLARPRTSPFHCCNGGSNPPGDARFPFSCPKAITNKSNRAAWLCVLHQTIMRLRRILSALVAGSLALVLTGCFSCSVKQNPQQLKEKTAETTAALKSDAKAVAAGVREGWSRDK